MFYIFNNIFYPVFIFPITCVIFLNGEKNSQNHPKNSYFIFTFENKFSKFAPKKKKKH